MNVDRSTRFQKEATFHSRSEKDILNLYNFFIAILFIL